MPKFKHMKKITFIPPLCFQFLGIAILISSCRRDIGVQQDTLSKINPVILKAKHHIDSLIRLQGSDAFVKKMEFIINWNKAITDSAGNIRVPMYFDLNKLKPKDNKQISPPKNSNVFELFIKNDKGQNDVTLYSLCI